ncbi:MAG: flagellar hook protein FlgE [Oligoflexia bacterium]|nr:flagellar hook protein FlgE [Oligoflexia bacterium]MBF0365817.1 flagellar hook protein FlgE [Oligoflexia bacterium]
MSILGSFNVGITGLNSIGGGMAVIADNIANASTNGFKSSRPEFQDVLASSLKGIDGGDQIGAGTKLAHTRPVFTQGSLVRTMNVTDLGINGNGFFSVDAPFGRGFTRDGSFNFDKEGVLVTGDGYPVLGFTADESGKVTSRLEQIKLGGTTIPAKGTSLARVQMNLDSRADIQKFEPERPDKTSNYNAGMVVYDNVGSARLVTVYFNKVEENKWEYHAMVKSSDTTKGDKSKEEIEMANGVLEFSDKGVLKKESPGMNSFNFNKGAAPDQKIDFDFGQSSEEGGNGLDCSTQYGSSSSVARHSQNGASAATLGSLSFNDSGVLTAVYNNGEVRDLAQIAVAKFENNEGLFKVGKNLYKETRRSGQGAVGKPGEHGRGDVLAKSLEESNVDIAAEFVNLMKSQRNFTANTRTITTADQMLQEILNIKR